MSVGAAPSAASPVPGAPPADPAGPAPGSAARRPRAARTLLALATAGLLLAAAGLLVRAGQLADAPAAGDRALADGPATARVTEEVGEALRRVFSYRPDDTAATREAARTLLAGRAARQYALLFGGLEQQAAAQKLTLTTRVVRAGVVRLTDHEARLLVFLDQVAVRAGGPATTVAAQLSVTAAREEDGRWRITELGAR
ncbi:hypothetical protein NX801_20400 [Streptomyces sp. LP05-1]|uniref:Mce-associated membrane protein n=1 Tax=Streptomyces pyxinae TaxID=2970734 RepID=A0ABT2CKP0_9ACTN|nr:hypothetical protein [Streptomyces sp. LP05-1]MCS0637972.1 hypothetical protein [Streptomyces sp. LP05-1]